MSSRPFVVSAALTAIAVGFRNPLANYVADKVMPRMAVPGDAYKYDYYPPEEDFTVPDTTVGRRGSVNEVEFSAEQRSGAVIDRGLDSTIPQSDIDVAAAQRRQGNTGYDPEARATEGVANLVRLDREKRCAGVVFNPANYAGNTVALAAAAKWTDPASDPTTAVLDACDSTFIARPNIGVIGRLAFTRLRRHPKIIEAVAMTGAKEGRVTAKQIAELWELDELIIGDSQINAARPGRAAAYERVWGPHLALLHVNPAASPRNGIPTWGFTAEWRKFQGGALFAGRFFNPRAGGIEGGVTVRVGEYVEEHVSAPQTGFLFEDVI